MSKYLKYVVGVFALFLASYVGTACGSSHPTIVSTKTVNSAEPPKQTTDAATKTKELSVLAPPADRTVYIVGEIDTNAIGIASKITELGAASNDPIYVVLTSPGGSVLTGAQVIAAMESSKAPVYTVCNVICASMAAMIFEHGAKRYIGDRSFVMFHPASGGAQGELDKMVSRLTSMQRYIGKMEAFIAKRSGLTFEQYKARAGIEAWIDGEDAVNSGFADHLASVLFPANSPFTGFVGRNDLVGKAIELPDTFITTTMPPLSIKW